MTSGFLERRIDSILEEAFQKGRAIVDAEILTLFAEEPGRYDRFAFMVGWGPSLYGPGAPVGPRLTADEMSPRAQSLMLGAASLYDVLGGDNHQILSDGSILDGKEVADLPPVAFFNPEHLGQRKILRPVYVLGAVDRDEDGLPCDGLQVRPVEDGNGEYTMIVNATDVVTMTRESFSFTGGTVSPRLD